MPLDKRAEGNGEPLTKGGLESSPEGTIHVGRGWADRELKKYAKLKEDGEPEEDQGVEREKNAFYIKVHELFERQELSVQARKEKEMGPERDGRLEKAGEVADAAIHAALKSRREAMIRTGTETQREFEKVGDQGKCVKLEITVPETASKNFDLSLKTSEGVWRVVFKMKK